MDDTMIDDMSGKEKYDQFLQRAMKGQLSPTEKKAVSDCERQAYIKVFGGVVVGALAARYIAKSRQLGLRAIPVYFALTLGGSYAGGYFAAQRCKTLLDAAMERVSADTSEINMNAKYHTAHLDKPDRNADGTSTTTYYNPQWADNRRENTYHEKREDLRNDDNDDNQNSQPRKNITYEELRNRHLQELNQQNEMPSYRHE